MEVAAVTLAPTPTPAPPPTPVPTAVAVIPTVAPAPPPGLSGIPWTWLGGAVVAIVAVMGVILIQGSRQEVES